MSQRTNPYRAHLYTDGITSSDSDDLESETGAVSSSSRASSTTSSTGAVSSSSRASSTTSSDGRRRVLRSRSQRDQIATRTAALVGGGSGGFLRAPQPARLPGRGPFVRARQRLQAPHPIRRDQLPKGRFVGAEQQIHAPAAVRVELRDPQDREAQGVRVELRDPEGEADGGEEALRGRVSVVAKAASGAASFVEQSTKTAKKTEQIFYQTKQLIFDHLTQDPAVPLNLRTIDEIHLRINYSRREAVITDPETGDRITTLDLTNFEPIRNGQDLKGLMEEMIKLHKSYSGGKLSDFHSSAHGPVKGTSAFRIAPGVGETMEKFIKQDMTKIMAKGARGAMGVTAQQHVNAAKRIATAEVYRKQLADGLTQLIRRRETALQRDIENGIIGSRIEKQQYELRLLNKKLRELMGTRLEALYYVATQMDYINDQRQPGSPVQKARTVAQDMRSHLITDERVHIQRTKNPLTWPFGETKDTTEYMRFAAGVGALTIPAQNREAFNLYASRESLPANFTTGLTQSVLHAAMSAHEVGNLQNQPALNALLEGVADSQLQRELTTMFTTTQEGVVALHGRIDAIAAEPDALEQCVRFTNESQTALTPRITAAIAPPQPPQPPPLVGEPAAAAFQRQPAPAQQNMVQVIRDAPEEI